MELTDAAPYNTVTWYMRDVTTVEAAHASSTFTEFNVRQEKGKPHFIRLHDSVVRGLERQLAAGKQQSGILLGSIDAGDNCTIAVEEFEPAAKPHQRIARRKVVGHYRSHSQSDFAPDAADRALFHRSFPKDAGLLLLVKPPKAEAGTAMFFLGQNGQLADDRATVEFPFNLRELGAEESPVAAAVPAVKAPPSLM